MGEIAKMYEKCDICHKRKAEYLCDMPKFRSKALHLKKDNGIADYGVTDYENSFKWITHTCDAKICCKCAVEVGGDIHFCKQCMNKLRA